MEIPHNSEAEEAVLGSLIIDRDAIVKVADLLKPADFFGQERAEIYRAILALWDDRKPGDMLTIRAELLRRGKLGERDGQVKPAYLALLGRASQNPVHVEYYARIVKRHSSMRELLRFSGELAQLATRADLEAQDAFSQAREKLDRLTLDANPAGPAYFMPHESTLEWIDRFNGERFDPWQQECPVRLRFGWEDIDGIPGSFPPLMAMLPQTLTTVLAYTNVGKTIFCQQVADVNAKEGAHVLYLHTELSHEQMIARRFNRMTKIPVLRQLMASQGIEELTPDETVKMAQAAGSISTWKGRVDFVLCPNWGGDKIAQVVKARQAAAISNRGRGYDLLVVDYLQRTGPAHGFSYGEKSAWMGHNVNLIGGLINELGMAGLMASQVSERDGGEKERDDDGYYPTPDMGSGGWTGDIERMSNQMLGITRQREGVKAKFICLKNTFGSKNWTVELVFDESRYLFTQVERP